MTMHPFANPTPLIVAAIAVAVLYAYLYIKKPEKSALYTGIGVACTFVFGLMFTLLLPSFNENWSPNTSEWAAAYHAVYVVNADGTYTRVPPTTRYLTPGVHYEGYTPQEERGRLVYQREGCMYCHTQQIRPLTGEIERYSIGTSVALPAAEREYIWDQPHFLGTRRIGPDLSRVGGKYSDDWLYSHFINPRQLVPDSVMPAFTWFFTIPHPTDPSSPPIPTQECRDLVAYIQSLGYGRQVWDPTLNNGAGGWRSWLKPEDQLQSQQASVAAVERAKRPVFGNDVISPTNRLNAQ
jgi:hypothetical protein